MARPVAEYLPTGIKVVVVGAGFGGLTTAIECRLKGHSVDVLEKVSKWEPLGDIISISEWSGPISNLKIALVVDGAKAHGVVVGSSRFEVANWFGFFLPFLKKKRSKRWSGLISLG